MEQAGMEWVHGLHAFNMWQLLTSLRQEVLCVLVAASWNIQKILQKHIQEINMSWGADKLQGESAQLLSIHFPLSLIKKKKVILPGCWVEDKVQQQLLPRFGHARCLSKALISQKCALHCPVASKKAALLAKASPQVGEQFPSPSPSLPKLLPFTLLVLPQAPWHGGACWGSPCHGY